MDIKELKQKNEKELKHLLDEQKHLLQETKMKVATKQSGEVRMLRKTRKTIAKILTLMNAKKK